MNYRGVYEALIVRAQRRETVSGYSETHHIIPRAHGGTDEASNLVVFTAREHFIAHKLLWLIHRDRATALAFRLLCDTAGRPRSSSYQAAKEIYANSMRGDSNPAKQDATRKKISAAVRANHPYKGKKRLAHAALMKTRGYWKGEKNMWYGTGERQRGAKNHMARTVTGHHPMGVAVEWETLQEAADAIGVSIQAVCQALRKKQKSKGWTLGYVV